MKKKSQKIYFGIIMAFLYLPIFYLIAYSFNDGKTSVWKGFTWKWYTALFNDAQIMNSLYNTLIIALLASVIATILGTAAAIGIYNFKGGVRSAIQNISNIPILQETHKKDYLCLHRPDRQQELDGIFLLFSHL